ncbi:MAG TPA: adenylosuccinate synthase [Flexilinea sp.]|nr:adenylosuccinate synthase [Flexilinea sp.]HOR56258.1 adenylosuccinate synthase [Flexilinea sp.]HPL57990.1 adenylosuccinate synthase [Flexilinea sp.]
MTTCAIVGINWGDEGKGRMVDLVAMDYDVVIRYQGGNNAGHTVVNEYGKFALNLVPSGIFRREVVNVLGSGTVVNPEHLCGEIDKLRKAGITITPENFIISDRSVIVFPYHIEQDSLEESRLADKKYGSTKRGIAPVYGDKYLKKAIHMGELRYPDKLKAHLDDVLKWKNLTITKIYEAEPFQLDELMDWVMEFGGRLLPHITDTGDFLRKAYAEGKNILYEAQLGALRDVDYGIYPYTSSSNPLASYAPIGSGAPDIKVDKVIGVVKAFSTCVGEGPFIAEWFGDDAKKLREAGGEYGAATGRPRRVGPIDLPATRYGVKVQGATEIAFTKLDVLSYMDEIPVCTAYDINGSITRDFPFHSLLDDAKPVFETMPGWKCDITGARKYDELPVEARRYIEYVENEIHCPMTYISVGPGRDEIILRKA